MKQFFAILLVLAVISAMFDGCNGNSSSSNSKIDKIIAAKQIVRNSVNYPDTLDFHDLKTNVSGNVVTLTFTAKNAFGVPSTHTMNINVQ
jgi:hypothetical protein